MYSGVEVVLRASLRIIFILRVHKINTANSMGLFGIFGMWRVGGQIGCSNVRLEQAHSIEQSNTSVADLSSQLQVFRLDGERSLPLLLFWISSFKPNERKGAVG